MIAQPRGVLGIKTADGMIVEVLDFQNQRANTEVFTTIADKQERARFHFFYRERSSERWFYLDNLLVNRIPPARAGDPDLDVLIRSDEQGNLVLGIDGPTSEKAQVFVLSAETLIARCSQADSKPVRAGAGRHAQGQQSSSPAPTQAGEKKGGRGWIAFAVVVTALILVAVLIGPRLFSSASIEVAQSARRPVEAAREQVKKRIQFSRVDIVDKQRAKATETAGVVGEAYSLLSEPRATKSERPEKTALDMPAQDPDWYRITWGDTLWRIAERFYGDRDLYNELADSNRLTDPNIIMAGEDLRLPPAIGDKRRKIREEEQSE